VIQFKYLGTIVANHNSIQEEIKRRLNSGNACYHSAQNLLSSRLLTKNVKIRILQNYSFACGFVWCETWSLALREEHGVRVFENRVLRRIFGPKKDEVAGDSRKLHTEELHNLYSSPSIIRMIKSRRMRWTWRVARVREKRNACRILVGKPKGKRPLGTPRRRWVDNTKMDLRAKGWDGMDWIVLAQDRDQ
jgi:hypothetical protein